MSGKKFERFMGDIGTPCWIEGELLEVFARDTLIRAGYTAERK
jgi:hypothetical protein